MNAPLPGHTVSNLDSTAPLRALLEVDKVSLEYRTPQRVVRATHEVSFAVDPADPNTLIAGTRPAGLWRSKDAGETWTALTAPGVLPASEENAGPTRVTQVLFDPVDDGTVWAAIEIGSIYRSTDRGASWQPKGNGLVSGDVHGIAVLRLPGGGKALLATTNRGLHRSEDNGETWVVQELPAPWPYTRAVVPRADNSGVVFLTNGNGPRLHHFAYWVPTAMNILHLCDVMASCGYLANMERGPGRHGISNAFFLYVRDPDGHRLEIYTSDYNTMDHDHEPLRWSLRDPRRQTLWGSPAPRTWFEEGSPFVGQKVREAKFKADVIVAD